MYIFIWFQATVLSAIGFVVSNQDHTTFDSLLWTIIFYKKLIIHYKITSTMKTYNKVWCFPNYLPL